MKGKEWGPSLRNKGEPKKLVSVKKSGPRKSQKSHKSSQRGEEGKKNKKPRKPSALKKKKKEGRSLRGEKFAGVIGGMGDGATKG